MLVASPRTATGMEFSIQASMVEGFRDVVTCRRTRHLQAFRNVGKSPTRATKLHWNTDFRRSSYVEQFDVPNVYQGESSEANLFRHCHWGGLVEMPVQT